MNIAFDPNDWTAMLAQFAGQDADDHPEWHVLRTQLCAALDTWKTPAPPFAAHSNRRFGSFSRRAARSLERIEGDCGRVNQTSSGNLKPERAMLNGVAGMTSADGRGQA
jgi:hypothetical protein